MSAHVLLNLLDELGEKIRSPLVETSRDQNLPGLKRPGNEKTRDRKVQGP